MTTATRKLTGAQVLYRLFNYDPKYSHLKWVAGVLFDCGKPATRLKALKALVDAGREVSALQFIMPNEGLRVDGRALVTMPLLDRGEEIAYSQEWYKH